MLSSFKDLETWYHVKLISVWCGLHTGFKKNTHTWKKTLSTCTLRNFKIFNNSRENKELLKSKRFYRTTLTEAPWCAVCCLRPVPRAHARRCNAHRCVWLAHDSRSALPSPLSPSLSLLAIPKPAACHLHLQLRNSSHSLEWRDSLIAFWVVW